MASTRAWLSIATGAALPARDRPSEFRATVEGLGELTAYIAGMADDCRALLAAAAVDDWSRTRATPAGPDGTAGSVAAAWALLHAMEHLREHTGQMLLTRQLWERRAAG